MENKFKTIYDKLKTALQTLPDKIAQVAQRHFEQSFELGGYNETPFKKWQERKNPNSKKNRGRAILIKTSRLSKSIRIISVSNTNIRIGTDVLYAKIHNEGGEIKQGARSETFVRKKNKKGRFKKGTTKGKGKTYKERTIPIPQRQFIGEDNQALQKKINEIFEKAIKTALK